MSTNRRVRILHLSDFHFSEEKMWDADPVLNSIPDTVKEAFSEQGLAPDVVAITGDIANKGKKSEYEKATKWINDRLLPSIPGFQKENLLLIPGNHDVDRDEVRRSIQVIQRDMLENGQEAIAEYLQGPDCKNILSRFTQYNSFASQLTGVVSDVPWWSVIKKINGCSMEFYGICSSWMSYQKDEQGDLLISRYQLNQVMKDSPPGLVKIALLHHPFGHLREFDSEESSLRLRQNCALVLRGHVHAERSQLIQTPDDSSLELACGSAYAGSAYPNGFHLIEIDPHALEVSVHYRIWSKNKWIPDRNAYGAAASGIASFSLKKRIATSLPPPLTGSMTGPTVNPIVQLIGKIQGKATPLSSCIADALDISIRKKDGDLRSFCQNELTGEFDKDNPPRYRTFRIWWSFLDVGSIRTGFPLSELAALRLVQSNDNFTSQESLCDYPISRIELDQARVASLNQSSLLEAKITVENFAKQWGQTAPIGIPKTATMFMYSTAGTSSRILEQIRTEFTKRLLKLLE